jgi:hypothetical protein
VTRLGKAVRSRKWESRASYASYTPTLELGEEEEEEEAEGKRDEEPPDQSVAGSHTMTLELGGETDVEAL